MNTLLAKHFQDAVEQLILDWKGQDEMFYHDKALRTIVWYVGKVKSYLQAERQCGNPRRKQFMEVVCAGYGLEPRRLQEALAVYKKFAKPSDSLRETCERIFQEAGGWSKALPAKPQEEAERKGKRCFHCPRPS